MGTDASPPPPAETPRGAARPRRRWRRWAVLLALLVLVPVALVIARERWAGPLIARAAQRWVREELGGELTLTRVSGSLWRDVVLEGVRLTGARAPLLGVEEARIELSYSLRGALRGEPDLALRVEGRGFELARPPPEPGDEAGGALPSLRLTLDLADLRLRRPGASEVRLDRLSGGVVLEGRSAALTDVRVEVGENRLEISEAVLDLAARDELELARRISAAVRAELPDPRQVAELLGLPLRSAELELSTAGGCAQVRGRLTVEGGRLELGRGELVLPKSGAWDELQLDLELAGEFDDVAPLGRAFGQDLAGAWRGAIEVSGPLGAPVGRFVGQGERLRVAGVTLDTLAVDVETDGERARFERCEIEGPDLTAVLRGALRLDPLAFEDLALIVSAGSDTLQELLPFPCADAFLHARLDGPLDAPTGSFEVSARGADLGRLRLDDCEARGRLEGGTLEVAELHLTSGETTLEAAGTLRRADDGGTASLATLALLWRDTRVELAQGAELAFGPGRFEVAGLALTSAGAAGTGRAEIALHHGAGRTRASVVFEDYQAGALLAPFLPAGFRGGRVHGTVRGELDAQALGGDAENDAAVLALDLRLDDWSAGPAWPELSAVLRGELDGRRLALEHVELRAADAEAPHLSGSLRLPLDPARPRAFVPGPVELRLDVETGDPVRTLARTGRAPGLARSGPCTLALELAGAWERLDGRLTLYAEDVTLGNEAGARAADLEASLECGVRLHCARALRAAPRGPIEVPGAVARALPLPRWLADRWALLDAPVALEARVDLADVSWVAGLSGEVRRTAGQVAGRVRVTGTALQPSFGGALELRGGELRLSGMATPIRDVVSELVFEDDVVRVQSLRGEIGGAPVLVTGTLEPFGPVRRFDLLVSGQNLLLARDARLRLRADADLRVKGTPSRVALSGELQIAEGRYTTEFSPLEELLRAARRAAPDGRPARPEPHGFALWTDGVLADAELALHFAGPKTFEYRTNLLTASLRPDLWLRGTGAFPTLEGSAYVEEAALELPSDTLELTSGVLTFRPDRPLLPDLDLTAEMRVRAHTVRATMTGSMLSPEVTLSSSPPLADDDLWVLVLTGQLPVARGEDRSTAAMESLAVFLARDALVRWFGGDEDDTESLLERFEIDVGAKTSRSGQPTGRVVFYLKPDSRRATRATYLTAEIDEYDRVNYAFGLLYRPR